MRVVVDGPHVRGAFVDGLRDGLWLEIDAEGARATLWRRGECVYVLAQLERVADAQGYAARAEQAERREALEGG